MSANKDVPLCGTTACVQLELSAAFKHTFLKQTPVRGFCVQPAKEQESFEGPTSILHARMALLAV